MVRRIVVLLSVIALGAAAPARAWCEASCLAPQQDSPHCPSHEPTGDAATISASGTADCPVLESARPAVPARDDGLRALYPAADLIANLPPEGGGYQRIRVASGGTCICYHVVGL